MDILYDTIQLLLYNGCFGFDVGRGNFLEHGRMPSLLSAYVITSNTSCAHECPILMDFYNNKYDTLSTSCTPHFSKINYLYELGQIFNNVRKSPKLILWFVACSLNYAKQISQRNISHAMHNRHSFLMLKGTGLKGWK